MAVRWYTRRDSLIRSGRDRASADIEREEHGFWGRCRSGRRWFWYARLLLWTSDEMPTAHGWSDTEAGAVADAHAALDRLADGMPVSADVAGVHGRASALLKELNAAKRAAKPPSDSTDTGVVEYLYGARTLHSDDFRYPDETKIVEFQITRKTPRRIYYLRRHDRGEGFVDRQKIERDGEVRNGGRHWCEPDSTLYLEPPELPQPYVAPSLDELKADMVRLHPDVGGDHEAFLAARGRYERAGGVL